MLDLDAFVLCEHGREPDECPACDGDAPGRPVLDPHAWVDRPRAAPREDADVPPELAGVPFS